jgi:hypothetical protein
MKTIEPNGWYSLADLSTELGLGVKAISREVNAGRLRASRIGRRVLASGVDVLKWLELRKENSVK